MILALEVSRPSAKFGALLAQLHNTFDRPDWPSVCVSTHLSLLRMYPRAVQHHNRSIETEASLIGTDGSVVYTFTARAHGHRDDGTGTWPDFWNDVGLNEFTTNGNTPTGLMEIDLNTPESDTEVYGKSNINRVIRGLMGNAETIVPAVRDGILIHSGAWPGWVDGAPMPNSAGCVHVHPDALAEIADLLRQMGVEARPNPEGSSAPYAFRGQGLMAVQRFGR